jgi:hypothetical protein
MVGKHTADTDCSTWMADILSIYRHDMIGGLQMLPLIWLSELSYHLSMVPFCYVSIRQVIVDMGLPVGDSFGED